MDANSVLSGDEEDFAPGMSQTTTALGHRFVQKDATHHAITSLVDNFAQTVSLESASFGSASNGAELGFEMPQVSHNDDDSLTKSTKKPLQLLDLPMDLLQIIIKEVGQLEM